jgi:hypothetical protein
MNLYIPKHLRRLRIIDNMCRLIQVYSDDYLEDRTTAFDNYRYYLKIDPVKRFLHFCINSWEDNSNGENENYESVIKYLSKLFYSVKGTIKVLEYMKRYLNLKITRETYSIQVLSFTLEEVTLTDIDEKIFYDALLDFLEALLYFKTADIKIELIKLYISNEPNNCIGTGIITYEEYKPTQYIENLEEE